MMAVTMVMACYNQMLRLDCLYSDMSLMVNASNMLGNTPDKESNLVYGYMKTNNKSLRVIHHKKAWNHVYGLTVTKE